MKREIHLIAAALLAIAHWVEAAPYGWGSNTYGELGDGTNTDRPTAVATTTSGALFGKTVVAVSSGNNFSMALTSDGLVYTWGDGPHGELGDGTTGSSNVPVAVDTSGVLSGKMIVAIDAADAGCYALDSNGQVYAWGRNYYGALGDGTTTSSSVPVAVDTTGVLSGKVVVAIAGGSHCLALTSDGGLYSWGYNTNGELGDGTTTDSPVPVAVDMSGTLSGHAITGIAVGTVHSAALTSTGEIFSWGRGLSGALGNGSYDIVGTPVAVDMSGVLLGKTIISIDAGGSHTLALSSDGLVFGWGWGVSGELGDGLATTSNVPVAVDTSGVLASQFVTAISAGSDHSMALSADGRVFTWGTNRDSELGDGSSSNSASSPVEVDTSGVLSGLTVTAISGGGDQSLVLAVPASTTISPASRYSYASNFGWQNWRWSAISADAPAIESAILHGCVYSANVGWIDLGDGTPTSGIRYSQTGQDYGVNHDGAGALTGYAYGANIGWIRFAQTWTSPPRVDLTTGALSGYAYSANCGWIHLGSLRSRIRPGSDSEILAGGGIGDGIADPWELERLAAAGLGSNLALLGTSPNSDFDGDGVSDYNEYLADTDPFRADDRLAVTMIDYDPTTRDLDLNWTGSDRRIYRVYCSGDLTNWSPVGDPGTGGAAYFTLTGPATPHLFFRVQSSLPSGGE